MKKVKKKNRIGRGRGDGARKVEDVERGEEGREDGEEMGRSGRQWYSGKSKRIKYKKIWKERKDRARCKRREVM